MLVMMMGGRGGGGGVRVRVVGGMSFSASTASRGGNVFVYNELDGNLYNSFNEIYTEMPILNVCVFWIKQSLLPNWYKYRHKKIVPVREYPHNYD